MSPLVTIGIPTVRRVHYLAEAVKSALAQTHPHVEVLISQDLGPEGLDPAVRDYAVSVASRDPRVHVLFSDRSLGLAGNWNKLAGRAEGEFLVTMGDDDRLLPEFVATLLDCAAPDDDVIFSNHYVIDEHGARQVDTTRRLTAAFHRDALTAGRVAQAERLVWQNGVPMTSSLIRTSHLRRLRFKDGLNTPEIEFFARLAHEGGHFCFAPAHLAEYRTHTGSATSGGLRLERLVWALLPLPVSPGAADHKRRLIGHFMQGAVERCLRAGDVDQARRLLATGYADNDVRMMAHRIVAKLPATPAAIAAQGLRHVVRTTRFLRGHESL
jgi:glycosyltransferase involved in cell wall biosynthesis